MKPNFIKSTYSKRNAKLVCLGYNCYKDYLKSNHWALVKKRAIESKMLGGKNRRCKKCNTKKHLHLHHKTYKSLGKENLHHLIWLCADCHDATHEKEKLNKKALWFC